MSDEKSETRDRETRLRRIIFRANHRGMKEMDILLGGFAKTHLESLSDADLHRFELLMTVLDQEFYAILVGDKPVPSPLDHDLMHRLIDYTHNQAKP